MTDLDACSGLGLLIFALIFGAVAYFWALPENATIGVVREGGTVFLAEKLMQGGYSVIEALAGIAVRLKVTAMSLSLASLVLGVLFRRLCSLSAAWLFRLVPRFGVGFVTVWTGWLPERPTPRREQVRSSIRSSTVMLSFFSARGLSTASVVALACNSPSSRLFLAALWSPILRRRRRHFRSCRPALG